MALPSRALFGVVGPARPRPRLRIGPCGPVVQFSSKKKRGMWLVSVLCLGGRPLGRSHPAALCGCELRPRFERMRLSQAAGSGRSRDLPLGFSLCHTTQYDAFLTSPRNTRRDRHLVVHSSSWHRSAVPLRCAALRRTASPTSFRKTLENPAGNYKVTGCAVEGSPCALQCGAESAAGTSELVQAQWWLMAMICGDPDTRHVE